MTRLKLDSLTTLLLTLFLVGFTGHAHRDSAAVQLDATELILTSHSFNAKKRSFFSVGGSREQVQRGLTIVHFNSQILFEHRTFDTYGSAKALEEAVDVLNSMLKNEAVFAILAHDSAAGSFFNKIIQSRTLELPKLKNLKGRQAYIMHNIEGVPFENVDDISATQTVKLPQDLDDQTIYFPKVTYDFEPSNDRYIAHAGGEVNGVKSTNSLEALNENYKKGFRLFELDIIETADNKLVAAHDWKMWARFTDYEGSLPPTHKEFMSRKIYGDYTTLDMDGINAWFKAHPDATLITDKFGDPKVMAKQFFNPNKLIMELFSTMAIEQALALGITPMISQDPLMGIKGDPLNYLKVNNIGFAAVSRRIIANKTDFLLQLRDQGIKVYVYNVNFDAGKDEVYVNENEIGLVYGMYADKWVFDEVKPKTD